MVSAAKNMNKLDPPVCVRPSCASCLGHVGRSDAQARHRIFRSRCFFNLRTRLMSETKAWVDNVGFNERAASLQLCTSAPYEQYRREYFSRSPV
jgi:hypothetical protein